MRRIKEIYSARRLFPLTVLAYSPGMARNAVHAGRFRSMPATNSRMSFALARNAALYVFVT